MADLSAVSSKVRSGSIAAFMDQLLTISRHSEKVFGSGICVAGVVFFAKIRLSMPIIINVLPGRFIWLCGALNQLITQKSFVLLKY